MDIGTVLLCHSSIVPMLSIVLYRGTLILALSITVTENTYNILNCGTVETSQSRSNTSVCFSGASSLTVGADLELKPR